VSERVRHYGVVTPDIFKSYDDLDFVKAIIDGTLPPDKHLAFAWRTSKSPPTEGPGDDEAVELLLLRLGDGAILARRPKGYWDTGTLHVNRLQEQALWLPDSSFVVRAFQPHFDTPTFEAFAIAKRDNVSGPLNLRPFGRACPARQLERRAPVRGLRVLGRRRRRRQDRCQRRDAFSAPDVDPQDGA